MKKNLLKVAVLAVLFSGLLPISRAQELKFGVVDFAKCQNHHYKTYAKQNEFKRMQDEQMVPVIEMQARLKELLKLQQTAQKDLQDPMFSEDHKKKILKEAQQRQGEVVMLQRQMVEKETVLQKKLSDVASGIQRELTSEVQSAIDEISKEKGMHLVFNDSFGINGVPTIAHADKSVIEDITDEVIAKLNLTAPEGYTVPADATAPVG